MCFSSLSKIRRRRAASVAAVGSSSRNGMEVGASERAMNCDRVGWTLAGQNEAGADDRKLGNMR
jgi:hypothetical protein